MEDLAASLKGAVRTSRDCDASLRMGLCDPEVLAGCRMLVCLRDEPAMHSLVLDALRLLRNLCAGAPAVQMLLFKQGVLGEVVSLLAWARARRSHADSDGTHCALLVRLCAQVLGNSVVGNEATQEWLWTAHFPGLVVPLLADDDPSAQACICMCVFNCVRNDETRLRALAMNAAAALALVASACGVVEGRRDRLAAGMGASRPAPSEASQAPCESELEFSWALANVELLMRSAELPSTTLRTLRSATSRGLERDAAARGCASACPAVRFVDMLDFLLGGDSSTESSCALHVDAIGELIAECAATLQSVSRWTRDEYARATRLPTPAAPPALAHAEELYVARALVRVIGTLAMTAPDAVARAVHAHGLVGLVGALLSQLLEWSPPVFARDSQAPAACAPTGLQLGLKTVLVRFLANVTYRSPDAQHALRESAAMSSLLSSCRADDANPQLREWALFAIRNACDDCAENQEVIAKMESTPRKVVNAEELEAAGMEVDIDRHTGRVSVRPPTRAEPQSRTARSPAPLTEPSGGFVEALAPSALLPSSPAQPFGAAASTASSPLPDSAIVPPLASRVCAFSSASVRSAAGLRCAMCLAMLAMALRSTLQATATRVLRVFA